MEVWVTFTLSSAIAIISTSGVIALFLFLSRNWSERKIQYWVKFGYDKKLLKFEHDREIRLKAEVISDLLAEWLNKEVDYQKINELSFKAFLWLPEDIAIELSECLSKQDGAKDCREIISTIRKYLLGKDDKLESGRVIIFHDPEKDK